MNAFFWLSLGLMGLGLGAWCLSRAMRDSACEDCLTLTDDLVAMRQQRDTAEREVKVLKDRLARATFERDGLRHVTAQQGRALEHWIDSAREAWAKIEADEQLTERTWQAIKPQVDAICQQRRDQAAAAELIRSTRGKA